jgi:hypothetical protein
VTAELTIELQERPGLAPRFTRKDPENYTLEDARADVDLVTRSAANRDELRYLVERILEHRRKGSERWAQELLLSTVR